MTNDRTDGDIIANLTYELTELQVKLEDAERRAREWEEQAHRPDRPEKLVAKIRQQCEIQVAVELDSLRTQLKDAKAEIRRLRALHPA